LILSKNSSNTVAEMEKMPFHIVYGMYNTLVVLNEEEKKDRKNQETAEASSYHLPSSLNVPKYNIPNYSNVSLPRL